MDTSTTATKALVVDETGACLGTAASTYDLETPRPLWAEQDPALWWTAAQRSIPAALRDAGVDGAAIDGVGLTGQMHGLVLLDESRRVVRPAILWNDQRSARECEDIRQAVGFDELLRITGNDAFPGFTLPKLLWVRRHEPEVFRRVRHLLL
ncbi:MAG: xylulokinase, partial [Actinobacteria bacterium]|nr:xylulokinase [Actinomycetota bacterium]NIV57871.1 xylulokinase [Actinomycetota bacterium]NIX52668.1 xylulokinase [Actinomycetota bacterium]